MQKVTGIGGIFVKAKDADAIAAWYKKHLGIEFGGQLYFDFRWVNLNNPGQTGHAAFSFFKEEGSYFQPSQKPFMINFRVKDIVSLPEELKMEGV
jgi:catechol 2,3-dioxygenase-like lactoylglutathione lyase family enzyme